MLGYSGVALSYESSDPVVIHGGAYGALRDAAPAAVVHELTSSSPYRAEVAQDPRAFVEQLSFYRMRMVSSSLLYLLYKCGVNVARAASAVSALSYVLLALVGLSWMMRHLDPICAVLVSSFIFLSSSFTHVASLPTPDGLAALIVVAAGYAFLEAGNRRLSFVLLTVAVLVRHETAILGLMFSAWLLLFRRAERLRARLACFAASSSAILGAYVLVTRLNGAYGWRTLFYHTFIDPLVHPASALVSVGLDDYFRAVATGLVPSVLTSSVIPYMLLPAIAFVLHVRSGGGLALDEPWVMFPCVLLLNVMVRTLLFPALFERFFLAHYLIFAVLAARTLRLGLRDVYGLDTGPRVDTRDRAMIQPASAGASASSSASGMTS
ncbi:hypothetical protein WMF26_28930 [Sorangium sp. So ce185]|uniref:hypothetical protein n=1 Tax=Sorangium sp. So ce185 TaxID=3133287 RepID=UPI003F5F4A5B